MKLSALCCLLTTLLSGCTTLKSYRALHLVQTAHASQQGVCQEFSCEDEAGFITVPVRIGTHTYRYIFDTGAYALTVTDKVITENQFSSAQAGSLGSSNQVRSNVKVTVVDTLRLGGLQFTDVGAFNLNFDQSPSIRCLTDGGLIGTSLIGKYIWQIDLARKKIIVTDELSKVPNLANAVKLPVSFDKRGLPFITIRINGQPEKVLVDMAGSGFLTLTQATAKKYVGDGNVLQLDGAQSEGTNGTKSTTLHMMVVKSVELELFTLTNQSVIFLSDSKYSLLGNDLLKHYLLTLNYPARELYLTPIPDHQRPEGFETFGFALTCQTNKTVIGTLCQDSPAWKAGLHLGDQVRAVDDQPMDLPATVIASWPAPNRLKTSTT